MNKKRHAFFRDEEALTIVEYAIAAGLIVVAVAATFQALGVSISTIITSLSTIPRPITGYLTPHDCHH